MLLRKQAIHEQNIQIANEKMRYHNVSYNCTKYLNECILKYIYKLMQIFRSITDQLFKYDFYTIETSFVLFMICNNIKKIKKHVY